MRRTLPLKVLRCTSSPLASYTHTHSQCDITHACTSESPFARISFPREILASTSRRPDLDGEAVDGAGGSHGGLPEPGRRRIYQGESHRQTPAGRCVWGFDPVLYSGSAEQSTLRRGSAGCSYDRGCCRLGCIVVGVAPQINPTRGWNHRKVVRESINLSIFFLQPGIVVHAD